MISVSLNNRVTRFTFWQMIAFAVIVNVILFALSSWASWLPLYSERLQIEIDADTYISSDITNFPVLVHLNASNTGFWAGVVDGNDVRFTLSDGTTILHFDEEAFDLTGQIAWYHVNVPTLSSTENTYIYIYYGLSNQQHGSNNANTWDKNFRAVYHHSDDARNNISTTTLWLNNPKVVYNNNYTYIAYINILTSKIMVASFSHVTEQWSSHYELGTVTGGNAHCAPSLMVDSNGYIHVTWGEYTDCGSDNLVTRRSTNINDITSWRSPVTVVTYDSTSYPRMVELSSGTLVLFYRHLDGTYQHWYRVRSTDGGLTWANNQHIINGSDSTGRAYVDIALGASDRIHLAYHWLNIAAVQQRDIYYMYSDDAGADTSTWKSIGGTTLTLPVGEGSTQRVYDSDGAGWDNIYINGIGVDSSNNPHIIALRSDATSTDELVHWEYSSGWNAHVILASDAIRVPEYYELGGVVDGDVRVVSSTEIRTVFRHQVSNIGELVEYITTDTGATWVKNKDVTTNSNYTNGFVGYTKQTDVEYVWYVSGNHQYSNGHSIVYYGTVTGGVPKTLTGTASGASTGIIDSSGFSTQPTGGTSDAPAETGKIYKGRNYNGTSHYKIIDKGEFITPSEITNEITVTAWVKKDDATGNEVIMGNWDSTTPVADKFVLRALDAEARFYTKSADDTTWYSAAVAGAFSPGGTYFICARYGSGNVTISVNNGTPVNTARTGGMPNIGTDVTIGARAVTLSDYFDGIIDELRLSDVRRSDDWCTAEYQSGLRTWISFVQDLPLIAPTSTINPNLNPNINRGIN